MFAKLSALAILLPFVSALSISCPSEVKIGAAVTVACVKDAGDPTVAAFVLIGPGVYVELNADIILDATVSLNIPGNVTPGPGYAIVAAKVDDLNVVLAETANFDCVD